MAGALLGAGLCAAGSCGGEPPPETEAPVESVVPAGDVHGTAPAAVGSVPSAVTARPVGAAAGPSEWRGSPAKIDQFGLQFSPALLVVHTGEPLTFTNSEGGLAHNVHLRAVADGSSLLDEDANAGDELTVTVHDEGGYDVLCGMHPGMSAFVFATSDPYAVFADASGTFSLGVLPPGEYEIRLWTVSDGFHAPVTVTVTDDGSEVDLRPSD